MNDDISAYEGGLAEGRRSIIQAARIVAAGLLSSPDADLVVSLWTQRGRAGMIWTGVLGVCGTCESPVGYMRPPAGRSEWWDADGGWICGGGDHAPTLALLRCLL